MGLAAGELRHRVRIERFGPTLDSFGDATQDESGEVLSSWQLVATVWAKIAPLGAMKMVAAQQIQSKISVLITIRYRTGIDQTMRINHNGTLFDVLGLPVDPDSGREWIEIPCSEGVNAG